MKDAESMCGLSVWLAGSRVQRWRGYVVRSWATFQGVDSLHIDEVTESGNGCLKACHGSRILVYTLQPNLGLQDTGLQLAGATK